MSDNKNVPEIRFEGFHYEWEFKTLGGLAHVVRGASPRPIDDPKWFDMDSCVGWLRISDVTEQDGRIHYLEQKISKAGEDKTRVINEPHLLLSIAASVGKPVVNYLKTGVHDGFLIFKTPLFNQEFMFQWMKMFEPRWQKYGQPGSQVNLNSEIVKNQEIYVPYNNKEQLQIGNYFQNLDKLITQSKNKHNQLVNLKKAMLEKMFPKEGSNVPEIRFKGFSAGWDIQKFGECVLIQRGGSPRPIENFMTKDVDGINWVKIGDVPKTSRYITKTKEKIIHAGEKHSRKVYKGDLILSNSMSFGRPYIMAIDGCIHDGWLLIRDENNNFDLEYLLQLLSSDYMLNQYKALASGGVVINLNSELVQSTTVYLPSIEEQQKIGAYFQNLDKLIALQKQQLEKLKNIKKACLDKMFV